MGNRKIDKTSSPNPNAIGRRSFLQGTAAFAGGAAAGMVGAPLLGNQEAHAQSSRGYVTGRTPQKIVGNKYPRTYYPGTELIGESERRCQLNDLRTQ